MIPLRHALHLALAELRSAPGRALALALAIGLLLALPAFTRLAGARLESAWLARARATPVVLAARGDEYDVTLAALQWRGAPRPVPYALRRAAWPYGLVAPVHLGHQVGPAPLVGVDPAYFDARRLVVAEGRRPALLGEGAVGADAARAAGLRLGDRLRPDSPALYNPAGAAPLMIEVVGIFQATGTPDDEAVFVGLESAWALDGHLHGHAEVRPEDAVDPKADTLEAGASLFLFSEAGEAERGRFHGHADPEDLPVHAVLVWPRDDRARDELLGDLASSETHQAVRPERVVARVLGLLFRLRALLDAWFGAVALAVAGVAAVLLRLQLRLRAPELALMARLGASRASLALVVGLELGLIGWGGLGVCAAMTWSALAALRWWLGA